MKTLEEILKHETRETLNINEGSLLHESVINAMRIAVHKALDEAADNAMVSEYVDGELYEGSASKIIDGDSEYVVDKQSILKLKEKY